MTAYRVIDSHKELDNIGTTTHDQIDTHVSQTPFIVVSGTLNNIPVNARLLAAGQGITITDGGTTGSITIASTGGGASVVIGSAENGSYDDGLFTDFTSSTPIGTSIDRFNEVLLALAPSPAPVLDNIDCDSSAGTDAYLSFGLSNNQSSESPAYIASSTTAGFSAVDVNGLYSSATSDANIRKGIYLGTSIISGDLNEDVTSKSYNTGVINYVANSFSNAEKGTLQLHVNGGLIHSVNLASDAVGSGIPGYGTASQINANGSGFINLSQTGSAVQSNSVEFTIFKHRTGRYQIGTSNQRNGWNYARVVHVIGSSQTQTNYIEWINDNNSDALAASNNSLVFEGSGSIHLSGVEHFQSGSLLYKVKVDNAYKYVYDTNDSTFTTSNASSATSGLSFSFAAQSKPAISTGSGETHTKSLHITSSSGLTASYFLSGSITAGVTVTHPLKNNLANGGQASVTGILTYNLSNTSTNLIETFRRENYRILSGSYDTQAAIVDSSNVWNSTVYMTSSSGGHSDGLQFFNQLLLSPKNTVNKGNFSIFANGPTENPNYSSVSGLRTFYRWFKNETGSSQYDLSLYLNGSSTLVQNSTSLDASKIKAFVKVPGKTGWMDVSLPFVLDDYTDGSGLYISNAQLSFDNTLSAINYLNFGNLSISNNEYIAVKILADASWTGNVSLISVTFGAGTGTLTPTPDLNDIDSDNTGVTAKLSFGSLKSIADYTNSSTTAGFAAADLNDVYQVSSNTSLRRAVFAGTTIMEGDLNESVVSPGLDYVANSFSDANSGSLKLEVNGSAIHTVDLTTYVGTGNPGSGTGTSLNEANGSGFISLSTWSPGLFDNGVPRYSEAQRTGRYRVTTSFQRKGWNYLKVIHNISGVDRETNYVEWINDSDSNALSSSGNELSIFVDDSFSYISGVKYFNSPSGSIQTRVSNIYKNIYSNSSSAISFTSLTNSTAVKLIQSGSGITATKITVSSSDSLQTLKSTIDSQNEVLHVSGTINFSLSKSLPGTFTSAYNCGGSLAFLHPLKSTLTLATQTTNNLLVWSPSDTSNVNTDEHFTGETYRLVSGSYTTQVQLTNGTRIWNSQLSMNNQEVYPEHATGLLIYDTYLIAPKSGGASGNFKNHKEEGSIESPAGNVNYSALTNSTRDYFRYYLNNTTNDRPNISVTLYGDAIVVGKNGPNEGMLGSNKNIHVHIGIPGKTGLLDLGRPSAGSGNFLNDDGCLRGDFSGTVIGAGVTNVCTFNGVTVDGTVSGAERIVIRIMTSKDWTGYLDRMSIGWG